jgi:hypothetical protein
VLGAERWNAVGLQLESVPGCALGHLLRIEIGRGHRRRHLIEAMLEPAGEMISRIRQGPSPAFQNVCHWLRGLKTGSPTSACTTS